MSKKRRELTREECKLVSGGSGYLIASGRTGTSDGQRASTETASRSGYLIASG